MKLTSIFIACLALVSSTGAQYFSEGWKPGQSVSKATATSTGFVPGASITEAAPASAPGKGDAKTSIFDLSTYLEYGPLKTLFEQAGINITERLAAAREHVKLWDDRIPLITDYNYKSLVVDEQMSLEEEQERVWFIVITVSSAQQEGISRFVDEQFDQAYNLTQEAGDLQHVRWGRIDYMNVTAITTKWSVWRAPFLVVATDRGQTLRFYRAHQIRLNAQILREFLKADGWRETSPWSSAFAPGGSREFILDWFAMGMTKIYDIAVVVPRWVLMLITGTIGSLLINLLHRSKPPAAPVVEPKVESSVVPTQRPSSPGPPQGTALKGAAKQRKGNKK